MSALKPAWEDIKVGSTIRFESSLLNRVVEPVVTKKTEDGEGRCIHTDRLVIKYDRKDIELIVS